jgi:hypothetical protein
MDDNLWRSIADLHRAEVKLDDASVAVMQGEFPDVQAAGKLAGRKGRIEDPILRVAEVKLDDASMAATKVEFPNARAAGQLAVGKGGIENPILNVVAAFEDSIGQDTVRNEYLLHRRIHEAFVEGQLQTANVDALNEWVYAELFLTPSSDPWLGLAPPDVYTALENDGRVEATTASLRSSGG